MADCGNIVRIGNSRWQQRQQALEIITYIAGHTGSEELRASFLALPPVQRLTEHIT